MDTIQTTDYQAARAACREEIEGAGISMSKAAREMGRGVSQGTLSQWLSGSYAGDVAAVTRRVQRWIGTRREGAERDMQDAGLDRFVRLGVTEEIELALAHAQAAADIACIHGRSGAGKTTALRHYCDSRSAAIFLAMSVAVRSPAGMLARVSAAVGAGTGHTSALAAETAIIERLEGRRALLVVDEAHHLPPALLDELRCIRDIAGVGLALAGDDSLWMMLAGSRRCDQIVGRIGVRVALGRAPDADVLELVTSILGGPPGTAGAEIAIEATAKPGGLHSLRRLLARAYVSAKFAGRDLITEDDFRAVERAA